MAHKKHAPSAASVKVAMVTPVPQTSDHPVIIGPGSAAKLAVALQILGNDRAYTVIKVKGNTWTVHFEGDSEPKVITFEGEKPEIL
jgi:hypothetical protein